LHAAARSGELEALCAAHDIRILTVYGSATRGESTAGDLDIGVLTEQGADLARALD